MQPYIRLPGDDRSLITVHLGARFKRTCNATLPPARDYVMSCRRPQITANDRRPPHLKILGRSLIRWLSARSRASLSSVREESRAFGYTKYAISFPLRFWKKNRDLDLYLRNRYSTTISNDLEWRSWSFTYSMRVFSADIYLQFCNSWQDSNWQVLHGPCATTKPPVCTAVQHFNTATNARSLCISPGPSRGGG